MDFFKKAIFLSNVCTTFNKKHKSLNFDQEQDIIVEIQL